MITDDVTQSINHEAGSTPRSDQGPYHYKIRFASSSGGATHCYVVSSKLLIILRVHCRNAYLLGMDVALRCSAQI